MNRNTSSILAAGIIMVWARFAVSAQTGTASSNPCINEILKEDFSLVEGVVVSVGKPAKRQVPATLEVRRVFVGKAKPGMLFKTFFMMESPKYGWSGPVPGPDFFYPPPKIGEKQIWAVLRNKDGTLRGSPSARFFAIYWPVRSGERYRHYGDYVKLAEFTHKLSKSRVEEQASILKHGVESPIALVSQGAAFCLKKWKSPACKAALTGLRPAIFHLPVPNQTYLDDALCEVLRKSWIDSPDQRKLLLSWTSAQVMNHYQRDVLNRLQSAWQSGELDAGIFLSLSSRVIKNPKVDIEIRWRTSCVATIYLTGRLSGSESDKLFSLAIDVIRGPGSIVTKRALARGLRIPWEHKRLKPNILMEIRKFRSQVTDKKLGSTLDGILKDHAKDNVPKPAAKTPNPKAK